MSNPEATNLNLPQMVTNTADKAGFFNDVARQLDNAMTASADIDCSVVGTSVDPNIVTVNQVARLHALSVPSNGRGIAIPLCTRLLVLSNDVNSDGNAQFTVGNTVIAVPPNNSYLVYLDGTANGALVVGAVSSGGGGGGVTTLNALSDVQLSAVAPGQLLGWNGNDWVNVDPPSGGGGGGATTLAALSDVALGGTPADGQIIKYSNGKWRLGTDNVGTGGGGGSGATYLSQLLDVDETTPPVSGQVLKFNGTKWAPGTDVVGTGGGGGGSGGDPGTIPVIVQTTNGTGSSNVTFPAVPTPGNLLLVFGLCGAGATAHPAAGWTMAANSAVGNQGGFIAAKIVASGDGAVVTPTTAGQIAYQAYEISGISADDASLAFNTAFPVVSDGAGGGGQGPGAITTTLPAVALHSLIVGAMMCDTTGTIALTGVAADGSGAAYTGGTYANYAGFHKPIVVAGDVTISGTRGNGNSDGGAHESFAIVTLAPKGATSGSGGGSSGDGTLVGASDYDNTTPATDGQAILWNAAESKFKPGNVAAGGGSPGIAIQKLRLTFLPGYGYYGYCVGGIELQDANGTKVPYPAGSTYAASSVGDSSTSVPANAFDGDPATYWGSSNASNPMGSTEWVEIDMPSEVTVAAVKVYPRQPGVDVAHQFGQVGYFTLVNAAGLSLDINFGKLAPIPQFGDSENRVWKLPV